MYHLKIVKKLLLFLYDAISGFLRQVINVLLFYISEFKIKKMYLSCTKQIRKMLHLLYVCAWAGIVHHLVNGPKIALDCKEVAHTIQQTPDLYCNSFLFEVKLFDFLAFYNFWKWKMTGKCRSAVLAHNTIFAGLDTGPSRP
jgi:hypothetical protein